MGYIPLGDEQTWVIFAGESQSNLASLEGSEQQQILTKLLQIAESDANPTAFRYEQIKNVDIIAVGDQIRLYTKIVDGIPSGNAEYHLIYLFYIDDDHEYEADTMSTYALESQTALDTATSLETVGDIESYLSEMQALDADALGDLLP